MTLVIFLYYIVAIPYLMYTVKKDYISPSLIFLGMQVVMFSGILTYTNFSFSADKKLVLIYFIALIMFILGTLVSKYFYPTKKLPYRVSKDGLNLQQCCIILGLVFISVVACSYLFVSSGYNVFLNILNSLVGGGVDNYTDERIALYSIRGVGYIYQFRVYIFPVLCAFMVSCSENKWIRRIGIVCMPLMLVFLLGTGQRLGFIVFVVIYLVALLYIYRIYRTKSIKIAIMVISIGALLVFMVLTIYNGRVSSGESVFKSVFSRIFNENQECAVVAFRYIDSKENQWGYDWFMSLKDILPGKNEYKQLSYVIFEVMYGTDRGTSPPCIWGSAYYNFGWFGIVLMPFVMGVLYHKLYYVFRKQRINKLRIFLYSAMFVILGLWFADNPLYIFNQGFITIFIMLVLLKPVKKGCENVDRR